MQFNDGPFFAQILGRRFRLELVAKGAFRPSPDYIATAVPDATPGVAAKDCTAADLERYRNATD